MAGVTIAMLAKPKGGAMPANDDAGDEPAPDSEGGGSSAKKLALLAVQAIKDGDDDAAADALLGAIRAAVT